VIQPVIRFSSLNDCVTLLDLSDRSLRTQLSITACYVNIPVALPAFHTVKHVQNEHEIITSNYTCCYHTPHFREVKNPFERRIANDDNDDDNGSNYFYCSPFCRFHIYHSIWLSLRDSVCLFGKHISAWTIQYECKYVNCQKDSQFDVVVAVVVPVFVEARAIFVVVVVAHDVRRIGCTAGCLNRCCWIHDARTLTLFGSRGRSNEWGCGRRLSARSVSGVLLPTGDNVHNLVIAHQYCTRPIICCEWSGSIS
jgi:hypothetical protein